MRLAVLGPATGLTIITAPGSRAPFPPEAGSPPIDQRAEDDQARHPDRDHRRHSGVAVRVGAVSGGADPISSGASGDGWPPPVAALPITRLERYTMTWIKTVPLADGDDRLRQAIEGQRALYPREYAEPVHPTGDGTSDIVASHSLIPEALYHAFATFAALMRPELPLSRRQHEMITTVVSVTNRCFY
jgi:hypothetical protein